MGDDMQIKAHYFFIPMNNTNFAPLCIAILIMATISYEAQKPLSEAYNNQCYLVETIECLVHDQLHKTPKQP